MGIRTRIRTGIRTDGDPDGDPDGDQDGRGSGRGSGRGPATWATQVGLSLCFCRCCRWKTSRGTGPAAERGPPLSTGPQEEGLLPGSQDPPESFPGQSELISRSSL
ncbi:hypothetical protein CesoFtcFv8_010676 [Champsocephalus esox]|uniref:Uncharacterized protein n=1 Tax=Champsocephalus esox TaxID=159716 RepID=A0AAN8C5T3_9TELE|nr:hypothetical protein CesoFtcFv8_010676 [Champsocephalus esox]